LLSEEDVEVSLDEAAEAAGAEDSSLVAVFDSADWVLEASPAVELPAEELGVVAEELLEA
jgi:hypothetical protein